jgi:hypothetical protein
MHGPTEKQARGWALGAGVILAVLVVVYLLWQVLKPVGDAAKKGAGAVSAAVGGVKNLAEGFENLAEGVSAVPTAAGQGAEVVGAILYPASTNGYEPIAEDFSAANKEMRLVLVKVENLSYLGIKRKKSYWRVEDRQTGKNIPATLHYHLKFAPSRAVLDDGTSLYNGFEPATIDVKVGDVPVTDAEEDIEVYATAPGYNPTPVQTVG